MARLYQQDEFQEIGQISDIRQVEVESHLHQLGATHFNAQVEQTYGHQIVEGGLICSAQTSVVITEANDGTHVFDAKVSFSAIFVLLGEVNLSQDELNMFSGMYGVEALHPYIRESLQNLTVRAGLPAFVLPPLEVGSLRNVVGVARVPAGAKRAPRAVKKTGGAAQSARAKPTKKRS
jgi:hypothetical protein